MKRTFLMFTTGGVVAAGVFLQMGFARLRTDEPSRVPRLNAAEHYYRQGSGPVPWSRFLRQP
jgi:hypothetical protein